MSPDTPRLALLNLLSLSVCLAVGLALDGDMLEVKSVVSADSALTCTAQYQPGVQYIAVRWYKVGDPPAPRLSGLLTRDLPNGTTRWYVGVEREVELREETHELLLPNVTCEDRGVYTCHLAAPVGEQNRDGQVLLTLADCPADSVSENLITDTYLVIFASVVLLFALLIFLISYSSLKNTLRGRNWTTQKEALLEANKPLEEKDLKLIYTLGPKVSKTPTMKQFYA